MEAPLSPSSRLSGTSGWTEAAGSEGLLLLEGVRLPRSGTIEDSGAVSVGERSNFKIFLRTRKIMVMHSNERGECCLHTLVDLKRKRSQRRGSSRTFSSRSNRSRRRYSGAPEFLARVQLGDAPRAPIQQSSGERVLSARRRGDDLDVLLSQGFA